MATDDFKDLGFEEKGFEDLGFQPEVAQPSQAGFTPSESALKGAQQGLTMGFSDEAAGGIQALLDKLNRAGNKLGLLPESPTQVSEKLAAEGLTGDIGPTSSADLYREARDMERAKLAQAAEQNPVSFTAGGVAGGLLGTAAIPGASAATSVKGATGAERILSAGKIGAGLGAAMGAGASEADLTKGDVTGLAGDVAQGAATGAITGTLLTTGMEGIRKGAAGAASGIAGSKTVDDLKEIFSRSAQGQKLANQRPELAKQIQEEGFEVFKSLKSKAQSLEDQKQELLTVTGADKKIDLTNLLKKYTDKVKEFKTPDPDVKKIKAGIDEMVQEISSSQDIKQLPADQAYKLKQLLQTTSGELKSPELQKITNAASRELQDQLDEALPGLKALNKTQSNLMSQSEAMFGVKPLENIPDAEIPAFLKKTGETLEKFSKDSAAQQVASKEAALGGFKNLKGQEVPGLEKIAPEVSPLLEKAKDTAKSIDLAKKIEGPSEGLIPKLTNPYKAADIAGKVARPFVDAGRTFTKDVGDLMSRTSSSLRSAAPENLVSMADDLTAKMGNKATVEANILRKASQRQGVSRDALIFSLMQRPGFREYINKQSGEETPSE